MLNRLTLASIFGTVVPRDPDRYYVYSSNLAEISVVGDVVGPAFATMPMNATSLVGGKPMVCNIHLGLNEKF